MLRLAAPAFMIQGLALPYNAKSGSSLLLRRFDVTSHIPGFRRQFVELYAGKDYYIRTTSDCFGFHGFGSSVVLCDSDSSLATALSRSSHWPDFAMPFLNSDIATGMDL